MQTKLDADKKIDSDAVNSTLSSISDKLSGIWGLKPLISLVTFLFLSALAYAQDDVTDHFVLKITTTAGTNASDMDFTFYTQDTNYDIDWNNDQTFESADTGVAGNLSHTFSTAGVHTIRFRNLNDVFINYQEDVAKYTSIEQWGTSAWNARMDSAFRGARNLTMNSNAGTPDMSAVTNMSFMFNGATAFNGDIGNWNTAKVRNMYAMFWNVASFDQDIGNWNTASVTDMSGMFHRATSFNQDIGNWNTAKVRSMWGMFEGASSFNGDIGNWNTAQVTFMGNMFDGATAFDQDIGGWNTAQVTFMDNMFDGATTFNQDIGDWDVRRVGDMQYMFSGATAFNQDIGDWDVRRVGDMDDMFSGATSFNQNLGHWYIPGELIMSSTLMAGDVATTITAQNAFLDAHNPVYTLSGTDANFFTLAGNVLTIKAPPTTGKSSYTITLATTGEFGTNNQRAVTITLNEAGSVANFITTWRTTTANESITIPTEGRGYNYTVHWGDGTSESGKTDSATHTYASAGEYTVSIGGVFPRIYFFTYGGDGNKTKIREVTQWGNIAWTSMAGAFYGANNLTVTATDVPDLSGVTDLGGMFWDATSFNQDIGGWNTEKVTNMYDMFDGATAFNGDIGRWNTAKVTNMYDMFSGATAFNQDISGWNVEAVTTMGNMFSGATSFNGNLSGWNTASVTNMYGMFFGATAFNRNIGGWNTAKVTSMQGMFFGATAFNQDIGNWNTTAVTDMGGMFNAARSFNQNIGGWNTAQVTDMGSMFDRATSFNQNIGGWNTAQVTDMGSMFDRATSFNQNIGGWNIAQMTTMSGMFSGATLSPANYDSLLVGWNRQTLQTGITFSGGDSKYSSDAAHTARGNMVATTANGGDGWTITDGGRIQSADAATAIFLSSTSTAENAGVNAVVGTLSTDGGDSSYTYALVAGTRATDNTSFMISGTALQLIASADYETKITYAVRIAVDGLTPAVAKQFAITVTDVNDAPVFAGGATATVAYAENDTTAVTAVVATDADAGQAMTLALSGADAGLFSITPAGVLTFNTIPDYEKPTDMGTDNMYEVTIMATDNGTPAMTATQTLAITVTGVNEHTPVFAGGVAVAVAYAETATMAVTTVVATDADAGQTVSFSLSGADADLFSITQAGELTFHVAPDFEMPTDTGTDNMYEITITATDNGMPAMTATQALTITVTDEDEGGNVPTGLKALTDISVYPNPTGAVLHISGVTGNARYTLSGIDGKVLKRGKLKAGKGDHSVAIPSLNRGIYLLQLTTGNGSITRKIVKE